MENHEIVITQQEGSIKFDFDDAKKYLDGRLKEYQGVIFTEETKADAKSVVAQLRKEKKTFCDRIKEIKAEYLKPFNEFMVQANELIDMFDQPIDYISSQISDFERKRIHEKQELIKKLYRDYIGDMYDIIPLSRIYNPKWENSTTTRKTICVEISEKRDDAKNALASIYNMHSEAEEKAISIYKETLDLSKAMLYISQYETQKREIQAREQERIRREEEERVRREEREKMELVIRAQKEKEEALHQAEMEKEEALILAEQEKQAAVAAAREETHREVIDSLIPNGDGETNLYEYRFSLTMDQKEKLEMYLESVGIDWEEI